MVRVRYAPSPTGNLHVGSARTVLYNWLFARHHRGTFVLRIEDTDLSRSSQEYARSQQDTLRWLGLSWDEGPDIGGPYAPYNQMARLALYRQALDQLISAGSAYACYCTPEELAVRREEARRRGDPPRYDGRCRALSAKERARFEAEGRRPAWRLRVPATGETVVQDLVMGDVHFANATLDDFILVRSDMVPVYNFVVVVDDIAMRITHVLRGDDHLANTPKQLHVYHALGAAPPAFGHLPSVLASDRSRLSKRHGPVSVEEYRAQGIIPEAILNYCALLGWSPADGRELLSLDEMIQAFDLSRVHRSGAVYDVEKLRWMNAQHIRRIPAAELVRRAQPWLEAAGLAERIAGASNPDVERVVALVQDRVQTLSEVPEAIAYFYRPPDHYDAVGVRRHFGPGVPGRLRAAADAVAGLEGFSAAAMETVYRQLAQAFGLKAAELIHPTRLALTGRTVGPSLFALAEVLGREECVQRLRAAADWIERQLAPLSDPPAPVNAEGTDA
jgi:nondiscriminating glutamyl-tRNA synthetase